MTPIEASPQQRVLALGIDSAEPSLIRELIDRGELPSLAALLEHGSWALVDSRGDIGSGAVWPTFFTGSDPTEHGMYSGWVWRPDAMACAMAEDDFFESPFWTRVSDNGQTVGVMDVPWARHARVASGFEVTELGPHDVLHGELRVSPPSVEQIVAELGPHPFREVTYGPGQAEDREGKESLSAACVAGARVRGDIAARLISEARPALSIVVFTEVHHTTHQLWHTVDSDHPQYAHRGPVDDEHVRPDLVDVYREVDRQIGRIVEAAGPDTAVMAFSLHGMKPGVGIPTILEPLLESAGFSAPTRWRGLSWRERAAATFGAAKRRAPASLRRAYHRRASFRTRHALAQPTIVAPHDWSRTRAFSLPTDQRGYIRVNLAGREAQGIVPERDYEATCDELEETLRQAETADGHPFVAGILRTVGAGDAPPEHLPDLIVDWHDSAFARPARARLGSREFEAHPIRTDMTGQHAPHGFCILGEGLADGGTDDVILGKDLHGVLLSALQGAPSQRPGVSQT